MAYTIFFTRFMFLLLSSVMGLSALAQSGDKDELKPIKSVIRELNAAQSVKMKVKKTVHMALMDQTRTNDGEVIYSKGRLRVKMAEPENSLIVMNEDAIWIVTPGLEESKPQVAKIVAKDLKQRSQAPLAVLLSKESTWDEFKLVQREETDTGSRFWLEPKSPQKWADLRKISLTLSKNGKTLEQLGYQDELENRTEYTFEEIVKNQKVSANTFVYAPPPGAEITLYE